MQRSAAPRAPPCPASRVSLRTAAAQGLQRSTQPWPLRSSRPTLHMRAAASSGQPDMGSERDREWRMADGQHRAAAAAARNRMDPVIMEVVDSLLESVPSNNAMYVLRLLVHAADQNEVARENRDAINDDFFLAVRTLLVSPQFKQATSGGANGAAVLSVFDSAWRAALEVRATNSQQ